MSQHGSQGRLPVRHAAWLVLLVLFLTVSLANAQPGGAAGPPKGDASPSILGSPVVVLDLADCLHLAMERQPRLAAQRASLAAAEDGCRALEAMKIAGLVDPEIPIRRRQAGCGVAAAAAALDQAERETVYAVTRTFFTVLYAREQERLTRSIVDRLSAIHDTAQRQLKAGARDVTDTDVSRSLVYTRLAETQRIHAGQGVKRAVEALKEAIGLCQDFIFEVAPGRLPEPALHATLDDIVAAALARRGELTRANVFAEVTCLEVDVQGICLMHRKETFAAGSDIHVYQVPQKVENTEYRPGAIAPEMPVLLVGSRPERVRHAQSLHCRAKALVDVTRNLIALEAADAFLRWEEASRQIAVAREGAEVGDKMADNLTKDFTAGLKVRVEEVINARVLAAQARAQYNEFLYKQILALADLERVTAGGVASGLVEASAPPAPQASSKGDGAK